MLSESAAEVLTLAVAGRVAEALARAETVLADADPEDLDGQAAVWYSISSAQLYSGAVEPAVAPASRCLDLARHLGSPGWASNALSLRALAYVRLRRLEEAMADLAVAEVDLEVCDDLALACWAHTGLGYTYQEMRLYELAEPHFLRAQQLDASPIPFEDAPVVDLLNLAEVYSRWADELERAMPEENSGFEAARRRAEANDYATLAVAKARRHGSSLLPSARAVELCTRPRTMAAQSLPELQAAFEDSGHNDAWGSRAVVGGAYARALWRTGRRDKALAVARACASDSARANDWQVEASARWLLGEMEHEAGLPGATAGRDYARLLSRVLWQQRLSTLAGAEATVAMERLHHDKAVAQRHAREDPLTGVGNRRLLDDALEEAALAHRRAEDVTSLLLVDLDGFKAINDSYGHTFGDRVLREVAAAIRQAARADDLVARLGGDEFVVLARGTDAPAADALADRVREALGRLELTTPDGSCRIAASVGVRTTGAGLELADLLAAADEAMYGAKRRVRDVDPVSA